METGYFISGWQRKKEEIGGKIRDFRQKQSNKSLDSMAQEMEKYQESNNTTRYTLSSILGYIQAVEKGDIYGTPSLNARKGKRGKNNLERLAQYLRVLKVPEDDEIVNSIKQVDKRFNYTLRL